MAEISLHTRWSKWVSLEVAERSPWLLPGLVALLVVGPLLAYLAMFHGVPQIDAHQARALLTRTPATVTLVAIGDRSALRPEDPAPLRLPPEARAWQLPGVERGLEPLPAGLQGSTLLLLSDSGAQGLAAMRRLRAQGVPLMNIRGGRQAWLATETRPAGAAASAAQGAMPAGTPVTEISLLEQVVAVSAVGLVKPLYMLLAAGLIAWLWRQRAADLVLVRRGLLFFLAGELSCWVNIGHSVLWGQRHMLLEFGHAAGMALALVLLALGLQVGLEVRVIRHSHPRRRCALAGLCRQCWKHGPADCALRRLSLFLAPALAVLALIPLTAPLMLASRHVLVFGVPTNYTQPALVQLFQFRYLPVLTILLALAALVLLWWRGMALFGTARLLLSAAAGVLIYSLLLLALLSPYQERQFWFVFWEEATELLLMVGLIVGLWQFRARLFDADAPASAGDPRPVAARRPAP